MSITPWPDVRPDGILMVWTPVRTVRTPTDTYVELAEASQRLGLSQEALRERLQRGTLNGCKLAGSNRLKV